MTLISTWLRGFSVTSQFFTVWATLSYSRDVLTLCRESVPNNLITGHLSLGYRSCHLWWILDNRQKTKSIKNNVILLRCCLFSPRQSQSTFNLSYWETELVYIICRTESSWLFWDVHQFAAVISGHNLLVWEHSGPGHTQEFRLRKVFVTNQTPGFYYQKSRNSTFCDPLYFQ